LLFSEYSSTKQTTCCKDGTIDTPIMRKKFAELNSPPDIFANMLKDPILASKYREMSLGFNRIFSYSCTKNTRAPDTEKGSRTNFVKINGNLHQIIYGLTPPDGKEPAFAQIYTVGDEAAKRLRREYFKQYMVGRAAAPFTQVEQQIFDVLDEMMKGNPISKTLMNAGQLQEGQDINEINVSLFLYFS
jgi:hypothetical protein